VSYSIDYSGERPAQTSGPLSVAPLGLSQTPLAPPSRRRRFALPAIMNTALTFGVAGALFFGAEAYAPDAFRPSTAVGTYDSRVTAAVKAAELEQQSKYEAWAAEVKISSEQQVESYRAIHQGMLADYQASLDRGKIFAEATARIQGQYVAARIAQTQMSQSSDQSVINMTRMFGRVMNGLEPGAGDGALRYAGSLSSELSGELEAAATRGVTISIEGWDSGLRSVEDLRRTLESVKPIAIPPPPKLEDNVDLASSSRR
jgi:hypothetical protein